MILEILLFGVAVFMLSFQIVKKHGHLEPTELALYIVLIAWGSMIFGIILSHGETAVVSAASLR